MAAIQHMLARILSEEQSSASCYGNIYSIKPSNESDEWLSLQSIVR